MVLIPCGSSALLLHYSECRAHCSGYEDVASRLSKHVVNYDKSRLDFSGYATRVADAVARARDLDPSGVDHGRNPSTSVWRIVEKIMEPGP